MSARPMPSKMKVFRWFSQFEWVIEGFLLLMSRNVRLSYEESKSILKRSCSLKLQWCPVSADSLSLYILLLRSCLAMRFVEVAFRTIARIPAELVAHLLRTNYPRLSCNSIKCFTTSHTLLLQFGMAIYLFIYFWHRHISTWWAPVIVYSQNDRASHRGAPFRQCQLFFV